tara:strand:+ start:131 stop:442 length:312 start_codon:yes stop_codon:yes gene_type:complete
MSNTKTVKNEYDDDKYDGTATYVLALLQDNIKLKEQVKQFQFSYQDLSDKLDSFSSERMKLLDKVREFEWDMKKWEELVKELEEKVKELKEYKRLCIQMGLVV